MKQFITLVGFIALATITTAQNNSQVFNGSNSYVNIGNSVLTGARTIEMWIRPNQDINPSINDFQIPLQRQTDNCNNCHEVGLVFDYNALSTAGKLRFKIHDSLGVKYEVFSDSNNWKAGRWYHIAGVVDSLDGISLYVNGVKQVDTEPGWTNAVFNHNQITAIGSWGDQFNRNFDGNIDEVRISSIARYGQNFTPSCEYNADNNTLGLYNLDVVVGALTPDSSGNNFNGTVNNLSASINIACNQNPNGLNQNNSQIFNGSNSYIDIGNNVLTGARTIEMWIKPNQDINSSISNFQIPLQRQTDNCNNCHEVGLIFDYNALTTAGKLRFKIHDSLGIKYEVFSDSNSWKSDTWYHIAGVIDPFNGMSLYVNGVKQVDIEPGWTNAVFNHSQITAIGSWGDQFNRNFDGNIDEVRISNIARYNQNFSPLCEVKTDSNTLGLYNLDVVVGSLTPDSSGNNYNGIVNAIAVEQKNSCILVGIEDSQINKSDFQIFPNPTEGVVKIKGAYSYLTIHDINGKLLSRQEFRNELDILDLSNYKSGVYFIKIIDEKAGFNIKKIIKN